MNHIIDPDCERIILEALPLIGGIQMTISEDDLEYFMETLAPVCNHEKSKSRERLLDSVFGKCMSLSDELLESGEG